ncbi:MAG: hypothetical protein ABW217_19005 [Polyangiaceae bacterium]
MRRNHENAGIRCSQARHRALSALITLSLAATLGVGCSGEGIAEEAGATHPAEEAEANDPAENALIESHLQARGYDTSEVQFQGDSVIVEGDMQMSRALLLDEAEAEATGLVEKGYFHGTTLFAGKRIQLSFGPGVSAAWQTAINTARSEWNGKTPMFIREPGAAATITVTVEAMVSRGRPDTGTLAIGSLPPERTIRLNSNYDSTDCGGSLEGVPTKAKTKIALHEMGHVLGFAHPPPNPTDQPQPRTHIAGTATSPNTGTTPSYATVMARGCSLLTALAPDDVKSAAAKYPSCLFTCETNCLSLGEPGAIGLCQSACPAQCR